MAEILRGQAVLGQRNRRGAENLRQVGDRVARDGEGKLRLFLASAVYADDDQRASVQDGSERGHPGLVVMLRAEICQDWIGEMALHQLGAPAFPVFQKNG